VEPITSVATKPTTPNIYQGEPQQLILTVRESVADELANDLSGCREEAERLIVGRYFPALAFRAGFEDGITWDELLGLTVKEAKAWEKEAVAEVAA
jgi:hypothetical protein